jgi:hypothetical protein
LNSSVDKDYEWLGRRSGLIAGAMANRQSCIGARTRGPAAADFWLSAIGEPAQVVTQAVVKSPIVGGRGETGTGLVA